MDSRMIITSSVFEDGQPIPSAFSCDGQGLHPPLTIADVAEEAKSLVIIVDDPDAPMGTFVHWLLWNIPATTRDIVEDGIPEGTVEGKNSMGQVGWVAPCPPSGTHRYRFHLFALNQTLSLAEGADRSTLENAMKPFVIARSELIGTYKRAR